MTTTADLQAAQVPLLELLDGVPGTARVIVEHDWHASRSLPVGRLCAQAAARIRHLESQVQSIRAERSLSELSQACEFGYRQCEKGSNLQAAMQALRDSVTLTIPTAIRKLGEPK